MAHPRMIINTHKLRPRTSNDAIKDGAYLTPKAERVMLMLGQGRHPKFIAELLDVPVAYVLFVGKKTGFKASEMHPRKGASWQGLERKVRHKHG